MNISSNELFSDLQYASIKKRQYIMYREKPHISRVVFKTIYKNNILLKDDQSIVKCRIRAGYTNKGRPNM